MDSRVLKAPPDYHLCEHCIEREGLLQAGVDAVDDPLCSVCGGLFAGIPKSTEEALKQVRRYEFRTFAVGVTIPQGIQEREDELRSGLKIKGKETVKTQASRLLGQTIASKLRKPLEKMKPDLTVLVDMVSERVSVSSKPLFFYGRYSKPKGVTQKRELCPHCSGAGCAKCRRTGYRRRSSVEGQLRKKLKAFTGAEKMTFTWIGSEDAQSKVDPPGRPFVVEIKSPLRRVIPKRFAQRSSKGLVSVSRGRLLPSKPFKLPSFRFRTRVLCTASSDFDDGLLKELKARFRGVRVRFDRPHNRPTSKTVYQVSASKKGKRLVVDATLEGGLPVKRFISGELVSPSVSEVLKTEVRCRSFDICEVRETGKFSYAEITRI